MIIGGSKLGKVNALINLINEQSNIDKIYFYAKDLRYNMRFIIKQRKNAGIKHYNDPNAFIKCSNLMDDVYENIDYYKTNSKRKILIAFDDMIADIMTNKKFHAKIEELFERCIHVYFQLYLSCKRSNLQDILKDCFC